jgi:phenylacetic acid degradation protein paaN
MSAWFDAHRDRLEQALLACQTRGHWTPFTESPSRKLHPDGARERGERAFHARLNRPFALDLPGIIGQTGHEVSPYTGQPLGVTYPRVSPDALVAAARAAMPTWRDAGPRARVGVCLEILDRLAAQQFENAYATMHTAGQSFLMAFAGSGANSLDRGLEALAYAWKAMRDVPDEADFVRTFGPGAPARLHKRYRLMPRGVALVIACGSYPAWNAWPAVFANLATGNPVVLKPHPDAILPMALGVEVARAALREAGFGADLLTLAADTWDEPITRELLLHPEVAIIDFTGSQGFGAWIEDTCHRKLVYTETAGCNAALLESTPDLDATLRALAHSLCLFSAQMCTSPQNLFLPAGGVREGDRLIPAPEVAARLVAAIDAIALHPDQAAGVCGAIQSPRTLAAIDALAAQARDAGATILRPSAPYVHPEFPQARTATPLLIQCDADQRDLYAHERLARWPS